MGLFGSSRRPRVIETELSRTQTEILKNRQAFWGQFIQPELMDFMEQTKNLSLNNDYFDFTTAEFAEGQVSNIRDSFATSKDQLSNTLAQRGMAGSGVEAQSLSMLGAAEAKAVGNTVNQARLQSILQANQNIDRQNQNTLALQGARQSGINSLLSTAPRPTSSAPMFMDQGQPSGSGGLGSLVGGVGGLIGGIGGLF